MKVNGRHYSKDSLCDESFKWIDRTGWQADIWQFIGEWLNAEQSVELLTSGSTGEPKVIEMRKDSMCRSAALTIQHLELSPSDRYLLCIPARFVGGKMIVVRALESGADLHWTPPSSLPELPSGLSSVGFTALVPLQVERLINEQPELLRSFGKIIIGGAPLSPRLESILRPLGLQIWLTFGMTETASHIALRKVSGDESTDIFSTLEGVTISTTAEGRLVVKAPYISKEDILSTDLVELIDEKHFRWLGRADNVINSGGVKIIPEEIERKMAELIKVPFFVHAVIDERLGERAVLCVESEVELGVLKNAIELIGEKHKHPKEVWVCSGFVRTETGKVRRGESVETVKSKRPI